MEQIVGAYFFCCVNRLLIFLIPQTATLLVRIKVAVAVSPLVPTNMSRALAVLMPMPTTPTLLVAVVLAAALSLRDR